MATAAPVLGPFVRSSLRQSGIQSKICHWYSAERGRGSVTRLPGVPGKAHDLVKLFDRVLNPREIRRRLGMNQEQFWTQIGVTQSGGSRYESGRDMPTPGQRVAAARSRRADRPVAGQAGRLRNHQLSQGIASGPVPHAAPRGEEPASACGRMRASTWAPTATGGRLRRLRTTSRRSSRTSRSAPDGYGGEGPCDDGRLRAAVFYVVARSAAAPSLRAAARDRRDRPAGKLRAIRADRCAAQRPRIPAQDHDRRTRRG